jgi:hypothetical protein
VRVVAADGNTVRMSFGPGDLWQLVVGLLGSVAHLLVLPFEVLWRLLQTAAAGAAHLLLLPFEALWHLLQATAASAAAGISLCFNGLWHLIHGLVVNLVATVGNAAHVLIVPFEALCRWLQIAAASVQGIFPSLLAALSSAAHKLVLPFEAFGRWIQSIVADAAAGISIGLDGFWPLVRGSFASILATLAGTADELVPALEAFWRWIKTTAAVALPFVMCIVLVVSLVALVWYCGPLLSAAAAMTGEALMSAVFCLRAPALALRLLDRALLARHRLGGRTGAQQPPPDVQVLLPVLRQRHHESPGRRRIPHIARRVRGGPEAILPDPPVSWIRRGLSHIFYHNRRVGRRCAGRQTFPRLI